MKNNSTQTTTRALVGACTAASRRRAQWSTAFALAALFGMPTMHAQAQSGGRFVIEQSEGPDDEQGVMSTFSFTMPDMERIRTPDFLASDKPIFRDTLQLSEPQDAAVGRIIDTYLIDFDAMVRRHMADVPNMPGLIGMELDRGMFNPDDMQVASANPDGGGGVTSELDDLLQQAFGDGGGGGGGGVDVDISVGGPTQVGIMIAVGGPDDGSGAEAGGGGGRFAANEPGVMIAVDAGDGAEIPEELREKLQEAAKKIAEDIQKQMLEGGADGAFAAGGPRAQRVSMAEHQAHALKMFESAEKIEAEKAVMRAKLVAEVQQLLAEEQLERWPALERVLLRVKTLPRGRLDGERTDLVKLVDRMELTESELAAIEADLASYEISLDDALRRRNAFLNEAQPRIDELLQTGQSDKALTLVDRATRLRIAVRELNRQHADLIAARLEPVRRAEFVDTMNRTSFPRIYRPTSAQRAFTRALELDDLSEELRSAITEMQQIYDLERNGLDEQFKRSILEYQPGESRRMIEQSTAMMNGEIVHFGGDPASKDEDPIRSAQKQRRDLDRRHMASLYGLLTPEQVAKLPAPPTERTGPIIFSSDGTEMKGATFEIMGSGGN